MNLILLDSEDFLSENRAVLRDRRFEHIREIHGSQAGDSVRVGRVNGLMGGAEIIAMDNEHIELRTQLDQQPPKKLPLTIILALPRPKMIRRIFRTVAELGVERLVIINSYKVEKSFWKSPALEPDKVRGYLIDGLQQAKDTVLPEVSFHRLFKPFVEDQLAEIIAGSRALLAHPGIGTPCPHSLTERTTLAIGPEGGFTPYEVEKLQLAGFEGIHLGERILRVETALNSLVSKLYD